MTKFSKEVLDKVWKDSKINVVNSEKRNEIINVALGRMSTIHRTFFKLYYVDDLTLDEIRYEMSIGIADVMRLRNNIRSCMRATKYYMDNAKEADVYVSNVINGLREKSDVLAEYAERQIFALMMGICTLQISALTEKALRDEDIHLVYQLFGKKEYEINSIKGMGLSKRKFIASSRYELAERLHININTIDSVCAEMASKIAYVLRDLEDDVEYGLDKLRSYTDYKKFDISGKVTMV